MLNHGWAVGESEPADAIGGDPLLVRWSSGANTSYTSGLKGGISWALDPALCDELVRTANVVVELRSQPLALPRQIRHVLRERILLRHRLRSRGFTVSGLCLSTT